MRMKKKILVVYPHNFSARQMGIDSRFYELFVYFKQRDFQVDLFALKNFVSSWENQDQNKSDLIHQLFLYDFAEGHYLEQKKRRKNWRNVFFKRGDSANIKFSELPDYAFNGMKEMFREITASERYDFILISYVYWAHLLDSLANKNSEIILDLSDFTTLNLFDMSEGKVNIGKLIEEEIRRVNRFEKVMCISEDEKWFFSQFAQKPQYYFVPFFMKRKKKETTKVRMYDILLIASDNPFNIKGANWFFQEVYPRLSQHIQLLVVGKITKYVAKHANVTCIPFAPQLDEIYNKAKISICPLLGGTGIKIKVIESLSFEVPVVTTSKGVVGLPAKSGNGCLVADKANVFAKRIHELLTDGNLYQQQCVLAKKFFMENFEESKVYCVLDEIF
jgi:glycosyltransferase involved in cell wall biosynthesis